MQRHQLPAAAAQFAQAVGEFRAALALRPDNAEAHAHFGNILLLTHHLPDAVAQYEEALRLRPDDAATRQNLALARGAMGGGP
jgi:Flp pilus assembly protein TadD